MYPGDYFHEHFQSCCLWMNGTEPCWWQVNICSGRKYKDYVYGDGLVSSNWHAITWTNVYLSLFRHMASLGHNELIVSVQISAIRYWRYRPCSTRADSRFAPTQWEMSLQSNTVSHWLGANLESAPSTQWPRDMECFRHYRTSVRGIHRSPVDSLTTERSK